MSLSYCVAFNFWRQKVSEKVSTQTEYWQLWSEVLHTSENAPKWAVFHSFLPLQQQSHRTRSGPHTGCSGDISFRFGIWFSQCLSVYCGLSQSPLKQKKKITAGLTVQTLQISGHSWSVLGGQRKSLLLGKYKRLCGLIFKKKKHKWIPSFGSIFSCRRNFCSVNKELESVNGFVFHSHSWWEAAWRWPLELYMCDCPAYWCQAEFVPLCGMKAASQGSGMGRRRQLQWFPVSVWSCWGAAASQVCYSGVAVGIWGVREREWELIGNGDGRDEDALLCSGGGGSSREERIWRWKC